MKMNNTLSFTVTDTIVSGILAALCLFIFISCIVYGELYWWMTVLIGTICLWSVFETLRCFIIDFKITFDQNGFTVNEHNRLTSNDRIRQYKWSEIHKLSFMSLHTRYGGLPRLRVFYKGGGCDEIGFRYTIKNHKFTKLARYYSGREGIIKPSYSERKRKGLYQQDW